MSELIFAYFIIVIIDSFSNVIPYYPIELSGLGNCTLSFSVMICGSIYAISKLAKNNKLNIIILTYVLLLTILPLVSNILFEDAILLVFTILILFYNSWLNNELSSIWFAMVILVFRIYTKVIISLGYGYIYENVYFSSYNNIYEYVQDSYSKVFSQYYSKLLAVLQHMVYVIIYETVIDNKQHS